MRCVLVLISVALASCDLPERVEYGAPCDIDDDCASTYSCIEHRCLLSGATTTESAEECNLDNDCDNGLFCDGAERCVDGLCVVAAPPCAGECIEEINVCLDSCDDDSDSDSECDACDPSTCGMQCDHDDDCDDGVFCNGDEQCGNNGRCKPKDPPCHDDEFCDEAARQCV
jgi:hypothetical protein